MLMAGYINNKDGGGSGTLAVVGVLAFFLLCILTAFAWFVAARPALIGTHKTGWAPNHQRARAASFSSLLACVFTLLVFPVASAYDSSPARATSWQRLAGEPTLWAGGRAVTRTQSRGPAQDREPCSSGGQTARGRVVGPRCGRGRRRRGSDNHGDEEQHDDDGGGTSRAYRRRLACPYYMFNPVAHERCLRADLTETWHVSQHLRRRHASKLPFRCQACRRLFATERERDSHVRELSCRSHSTFGPSDRSLLDAEQLLQLPAERSAIGAARQSEQARWNRLWRIVFPQIDPPGCWWLEPQDLLQADLVLRRAAHFADLHASGRLPEGVTFRQPDCVLGPDRSSPPPGQLRILPFLVNDASVNLMHLTCDPVVRQQAAARPQSLEVPPRPVDNPSSLYVGPDSFDSPTSYAGESDNVPTTPSAALDFSDPIFVNAFGYVDLTVSESYLVHSAPVSRRTGEMTDLEELADEGIRPRFSLGQI